MIHSRQYTSLRSKTSVERIDVAIIGAGVVGLATANAVSRRGYSTCLLESRPRLGLEASTHNSGVIHAGIYYPTGSLKANLCVEGRERLYSFCRTHNVPHARCGKLIIGMTTEDISKLNALGEQAQKNGVDVDVVDRSFIRKLEPNVDGVAALWSPSTGIVETEALVRTLSKNASEVYTLTSTPVTGGTPCIDGIEVQTEQERILARVVVNAAGLYADDVSAMLGGEEFTIYPVRGEYAELLPRSRHLVTRPVYPLPDQSGHGLGVHLTPTTWGSVMLGPTASYQATKDNYEGNRLPIEYFHEAARSLLPGLNIADLRPGGTGIRARPAPADQTFADFIIRCDRQVTGLIHAAGIDSPGLTACLAIAEVIVPLVDEILH